MSPVAPGAALALLALLAAGPASAATAEEEGEGPRRLTVLPLPTIDVTPETSLALGAVALVNARPFEDARPLQTEVEATVTLRRQLLLTSAVDLFLPGDAALVALSGAVMRFPESYWGVGPRTPAEAEERYDNRRLDLALEPLWRPWGELYLGPSAAVQSMWGIEPVPGGLLDESGVTGAEGGWSTGLGAAVRWEGRDDRLDPGAGSRFWLLRALTFDPALGGDFRFTRLEADGRAYLGLGASVLALQALARLHGGEPPFRMLALLGGDPTGRGTYTGRYRDQHLLTGQAEVRTPVVGRLGVVAFAGAGAVAPEVAELVAVPWRPSLGGGLRVRVEDQDDIDLRLDLAWGGEGLGVYFGFGEAF